MKILLRKYCSGLVEGVDLIFRILCQISGCYKSENHIVIFRSKSYVSVVVVLIEAKGYCRNICLNEGFVCNCNFKNCAALLRGNSTNSLKVERRTDQSCIILIDIL